MIDGKEAWAVIPARAGSKGLPGKNTMLLCGKPLVAHSIACALKSNYIDRVIVSTDSKWIATMATLYGAEVPFLRPRSISGDYVTDYPVLKHCLDQFREKPDIIVHLRPTGPLRETSDIDWAIEALVENPRADSVRSVKVAPVSPYKLWKIRKNRMTPLMKLGETHEPYNLPRQSLPAVYQTTPDIGILWTKTLYAKKSIMGKNIIPVVVSKKSVDIDSSEDFMLAQQILEERNKNEK